MEVAKTECVIKGYFVIISLEKNPDNGTNWRLCSAHHLLSMISGLYCYHQKHFVQFGNASICRCYGQICKTFKIQSPEAALLHILSVAVGLLSARSFVQRSVGVVVVKVYSSSHRRRTMRGGGRVHWSTMVFPLPSPVVEIIQEQWVRL